MTYIFSGTPDDMMSAILEDLRKASEERMDADAFFTRALASLVGLYDRQAVQGTVEPRKMAAFRRESAEALVNLSHKVTAYVLHTLYDAESAGDDWYDLSMRRSAIQSLVDDYADTPIAALLREVDISELDAELRRVAEDQEPVPPQFEPRGLPDRHWWWALPNAAE